MDGSKERKRSTAKLFQNTLRELLYDNTNPQAMNVRRTERAQPVLQAAFWTINVWRGPEGEPTCPSVAHSSLVRLLSLNRSAQTFVAREPDEFEK